MEFYERVCGARMHAAFHKVSNNATPISKVLVGPFESEAEARKALKSVRASVEPAAFLTKI